MREQVRLAEYDAWLDRAGWVLGRRDRSRWAPAVAVLELVEYRRVESRFGRRGVAQVLATVAELAEAELSEHEQLSVDKHGRLIILLRSTPEPLIERRLDDLVVRLTRARVDLGDEHLQLTPVCGWASSVDQDGRVKDPHELLARATAAADVASQQLDLVPRRWTPSSATSSPRRLPQPIRTGLQVLLTFLLGVGLPFGALVLLDENGIDLGTPAYLLVTAAVVITAVLIWIEGLNGLAPRRPPDEPARDYPPASAIIPAYLPNEAATIVDTLRAFLDVDYPGDLQIVLAYNTPQPMPVEAELDALAALEPRLTVLRVPFSTSKSQNVNAALQVVTGEFTGIFDADHHPAPDVFRRAWRWLSHGADVVQGHCVIRNGDASWVARTVAVEFESIYAVSHPGRAKLHGFGLFGGSNGFWRTSVLHEIRMHGDMLTEDIDSSVRALLAGRRVVNDPAMISRELAPATVGSLWHQRLRWAQGWFQVSRRHLAAALRSPRLSRRNKLGVAFLLGWREVYPWLSLQAISVVGFLAWQAGGVSNLDWAIPTFLLTTLCAASVGPAQTLLAWRVGAPEIRRRRRWFWAYLVLSMLCYTEFKNVIARVAQLKELFGERRWVVTPR